MWIVSVFAQRIEIVKLLSIGLVIASNRSSWITATTSPWRTCFKYEIEPASNRRSRSTKYSFPSFWLAASSACYSTPFWWLWATVHGRALANGRPFWCFPSTWPSPMDWPRSSTGPGWWSTRSCPLWWTWSTRPVSIWCLKYCVSVHWLHRPCTCSLWHWSTTRALLIHCFIGKWNIGEGENWQAKGSCFTIQTDWPNQCDLRTQIDPRETMHKQWFPPNKIKRIPGWKREGKSVRTTQLFWSQPIRDCVCFNLRL